jgi:alkyl sulfatase BDS1-like metallo-beta-lactamase superfamily hydrolase
LPSPRKEEAVEWVNLAGGIENIIAKALELSASNKNSIAANFIETAYHADPQNEAVHNARAHIYSEFSKEQSSSMGRNILNHASLASSKGKRDMAETED